jgi:hypothetical protein
VVFAAACATTDQPFAPTRPAPTHHRDVTAGEAGGKPDRLGRDGSIASAGGDSTPSADGDSPAPPDSSQGEDDGADSGSGNDGGGGGNDGGVEPPAQTLLACAEQPYDRSSKLIGPSGGRIQFGRHSLSIPPHALDDTVTITAEALPVREGNVVELSPAGLAFQRSATLLLDYSNCAATPAQAERIVYLDDTNAIQETLRSWVEGRSGRVRAELDHFSRYAVAW